MNNLKNSIKEIINPLRTSIALTVSKSRSEPIACCDCGLMIEPRFIGGPEVGRWFLPGKCPDCQQSEQIRLFAEQIKKAVRTRRHLWKSDMRHLLDEVIPPLFDKARIGQMNIHLQDALLGENNLLLWGGVGTGKTYASMAALRAGILSGRSGKRIVFENLLARIRNFQTPQEEILKPYCQSDLLVIDDVGQSDSDFSARMLFGLIDHRIEYRLRTIIISNLAPEALRKALGERIFSRLQTYEIIRLSGKDRRQHCRAKG